MGTLSYFTVDIAECKEGYVFVKHGHYLSIHSGLEHLTDITSYYLVQIYNIYLHIQRSETSSRYHFVLSCIDIQHLSVCIAVWSILQISLRIISYRYIIFISIYSGLEHLVDITSYYLVQISSIYLSIYSGLEHLAYITSYYLVQISSIYLYIQRSGASSRYHFVLSCIDILYLSIYIYIAV